MLAETLRWPAEHQRMLLEAALRHLELSLAALAVARRRGAAARHRPDAGAGRWPSVVTGIANMLRTMPSLALLVLMLPLLGTGFLPAVVALTLYGVPAILLNTYTGRARGRRRHRRRGARPGPVRSPDHAGASRSRSPCR